MADPIGVLESIQHWGGEGSDWLLLFQESYPSLDLWGKKKNVFTIVHAYTY